MSKPQRPSRRRPQPESNELRPHTYDGIQEYDKRLPNWWLWTFYGAIFYSLAYWFVMHQAGADYSVEVLLPRQLAAIQARAASLSTGPLNDSQLWALSQDAPTIAAGKVTFQTTCVSCHGNNLEGGIGANLMDQEWIHGGSPTQIVKTIDLGVQEKGMPPWGPVLGQKRVQEVAAYILSHHQPPSL